MLNTLVAVALLFALGTLAIFAGKVLKNIIVFIFVCALGVLVWNHVIPVIWPDTSRTEMSEAVEVLIAEGVDTDISAPEIDWENPKLPKLPEVSIEDAFVLKPEIERYVFSSLRDNIEKLRKAMKGAGPDFEWPQLPESVDDFDVLTEQQRERLKKEIFDLFAHAPMTVVREPSPPEVNDADLILTGDFYQPEFAEQRAAGRVIVRRSPEGKSILRLEDFSVTNGPELMVYLCISPVGDVNVGFISLGELKAVAGDQNYPILTKASLAGFRSLVIYSDALEVAYGIAPLTPAQQ